jgi:uncharacterized protein
MIDAEVRHSLERSVLCWLATVDAQGWPNVSPKETFLAEDDRHLLIAHIASPNSVRNLRVEPRVCVSVVDVFAQKGWKLHGRAELIQRHDPRYPFLAAPLQEKAGPDYPVLAVIRIAIERVAPILAPSYRMVPGTTEASQIAQAMRTYGVRPG